MQETHPEQSSSLSEPLPLDEKSLLLSLGWLIKIAEQADAQAVDLICQKVVEITRGYAYILLHNQEQASTVAPTFVDVSDQLRGR